MRQGLVVMRGEGEGIAEHGSNGNGSPPPLLTPWQEEAAREVIRRVRRYVPAELVRALLFGSRARGDARPDSDVDILLIFRELPPDREPQAGQAEQIADAVAAESKVPVATWSVALIDLEVGKRTPMLVDALDDGVPLWPPWVPPRRVSFTPWDALRCTGALLTRVEEGGEEVAAHRAAGTITAAARRARGDVVRLCTAALLLHGETRPRRGEAVRRFLELYGADAALRPATSVLRWAADSYGVDGQDEDRPVELRRGGFSAIADAMDLLADWVDRRRAELDARVPPLRNLGVYGRIPPA